MVLPGGSRQLNLRPIGAGSGIVSVTVEKDRGGPQPIGRLQLRGVSRGCDHHRDAVVCVLRGRVTFPDLIDASDRALDLGLAQGVLWNLVDSDLGRLSLYQIESVIPRVLAGPSAPHRWAILAVPGPSLAAAAVLVTVAEDKGFGDRVHAFADSNAAFEWLGSLATSTMSASPDTELLRR